jgi:hypothetical protein
LRRNAAAIHAEHACIGSGREIQGPGVAVERDAYRLTQQILVSPNR